MQYKHVFYIGASVMMALLLIAATASQSGPNATGAAEEISPLDSTRAATRNMAATPVALQPTTTPTATPDNRETATTLNTIRVWWPDELYPQNNAATEGILQRQFNDFRLNYVNYELDVRRKRTHGLGGIFPTLRTAGPVAPGAMPDLTLMRRADMIVAATEGLIVPLDDWIAPDLVGSNLLDGVRVLGEIDGVLYGVPYGLTMTHTAYRASVFDEPMVSFGDILAKQPIYLFPLGTTPSSDVVLLQYLAAGGRLIDDSGAPILDRQPLLAVLNYYALGVERNIFTPELLNYTSADDYWTAFISADANLIGVDSLTYLNHKATVQNIGLAPVPTLSGEPITALDGWLWVLTTTDPDQQEQARAFLTWIMGASQQGVYTEAFGILPSQSLALRLWDDEEYADFAQDLIGSAWILSSAQRTGSAAMVLQESLIAVLEGASASASADAALAELLG